MKTLTLVAAALPLILSPWLAWSADNPPASNDLVNPMMKAQEAQTPPQNWTQLKGTVEAVDPAAKLVNIKDDAGSVIQIPVDNNVTIKKDGKKTDLTQIQPGDIIVLAKRTTSSQDGSRTY